jgi:outer membrane biosynthesis protein TonB
MQTHNLKLPKNYRDAASNFYIKVGIALIAILIILNVTLIILLLKETNNNRNALRALQETSKTLALLQDSLAKTDMQKAFVHLADARRQIALAPSPASEAPTAVPVAPPAQPPPTAKASAEPKTQPGKPPAAETKAPARVAKTEPQAPTMPVKDEPKAPAAAVKTAAFIVPAGETPAPLVWAVSGEYALIGEKESKLLHLFKFQDDRFALVKSYPCIIGANGEDKKKAGDFATPRGSYFTLRYTPGSALPEIYGEGALS